MSAPVLPAPVLPASLVDNPRLNRWIRFLPDRTVRIATGKVEMGQGVVTPYLLFHLKQLTLVSSGKL